MTTAEQHERRRLLAHGERQQARASFYEANPAPRAPILNSFQQWASDYARAFGLIVTPFANWVMIAAPDGTLTEAMTAQGVQAFCDQHQPSTKKGA